MPVDAIRDLGVIFVTELSMHHVNKIITSVCFYHIRRLKHVRRLVGQNVTATFVSSFVLNRLDYCNAILAVYLSPPPHHCSVKERRGETD